MTKESFKPYANSLEHVHEELAYLDRLLHREVHAFRQVQASDQQDIFKGMFISDREIDGLLEAPVHQQKQSAEIKPTELEQAIVAVRERITGRKQASFQQGIYLALPQLAELFGLNPLEEQIVVICLAPELDLKYERLYAYLQDDVTRKKPSAGLVLKLLCATAEEKMHARALLSRQAALLRSQIVRCPDDDEVHWPARLLKLDENIVNFLLGLASGVREMSAGCQWAEPVCELKKLRWSESVKQRLLQTTRQHLHHARASKRKLIFHFQGPAGTGKKTLASSLCREIGAPLLIVDLREVMLRANTFEENLRIILREAILNPTAIFLEHFECIVGEDPKALSQCLSVARSIEDFSWLTFIATDKPWEPNGIFKDHRFLLVELPAPDLPTRIELWQALMSGVDPVSPDWDGVELATKFRLTPGQMQGALVAARNLAYSRDAEHPAVGRDDLFQGCRRQSNQKLGALARKLIPRNRWQDITLPENSLAQLREICAQVKHRQTVYERWGFGKRQAAGQGLCVLFHGPSGTGKTLAVEIIANELQLETFRVDLATVVSKYIGETEKNLAKVFSEAETSNAILFFDEADALFGKRSEVKDAHDRYANIEINFLLQRMEEFEGLVILATNLRKNIDDAFFRRMHFAVEFPMPDEHQRYQIWKQHIPAAAPLADDINFDFLANRLNASGGHIRNIVVNAAFLAAENSGVIHMRHLIQATKREYEKMGRFCTDAEFAPYHALLKID